MIQAAMGTCFSNQNVHAIALLTAILPSPQKKAVPRPRGFPGAQTGHGVSQQKRKYSKASKIFAGFGGGKDVVFAGYPDVEGGQQEDADNQVGEQATDDDDGKGALRVRADCV
jgi:hypothetical protein